MDENQRYSRISDIIELLTLMQSRVLGITLTDIQNVCGVSRRTAERLRDALIYGSAQIDEIETDSKEKHWGFIGSYMNEIISFTPDEIATVESVKEGLAHDDKKQSLDKVITKLKALSRKQISKIEDTIELVLKSEGVAVTQKPSHRVDVQMLNIIRQAIKENRKIRCKYSGKNKLLAPYGIIYGSNAYLIGVEANHTNPYVYLLHKFSDVRIALDSFNKGDFNIQEYANKSFGVYQNEVIKVELLFSSDVAEDVLNFNFHPTQKIKQNEDGSVTVKFKASGEYEIMWHLFKWGDNVKIISPKNLKKQYIEYLENVLKTQKIK